MTPAQQNLYWREWQACSKARKERGLAATDANRHQLHVEALGVDRSMKDLTQRQFDRVLAKFRSFSRPADLNAQMRAEDQDGHRHQSALEEISELAHEAGIKGGIDGVSRYFHRWLGGKAVETLDFAKLKQVAGILRRRLKQMPQAPDTPATETTSDDIPDPY